MEPRFLSMKQINWKIDFKGRADQIPTSVDSVLRDKVYYYSDNFGNRSFILIEKNVCDEIIKLRILNYEYDNNSFRLKIECRDKDFFETFEKVFLEIFDIMEIEKKSFKEAYTFILNKYYAFLSKYSLLSLEEQMGLLGEMLFLRELLEFEMDALFFWIDQNEDFKVNDNLFEIKVTRAKEHRHIINGLSQLTPIPNFKKFLVSYLCEFSGVYHSSDTINLNELYEYLIKALPAIHIIDFEERMRKRGYVHLLHENLYNESNFILYDPRLLKIEDDFKCLNLNSVASDLLQFIPQDKVKYELNIQSLIDDLDMLTQKTLKNNISYT